MKKLLFTLAIVSLIFATNSVILAEENQSTNLPGQEKPTLYSNSGSGNLEQTQIQRDYLRKIAERNQNGLASSTRPNKEKISNPNEIRFFEKIEKIGTALWGMRKNNEKKPEQIKSETPRATSTKPEMSRASSTKSVIEKIANPNEIKFFEKIEKIGTALWGMRKENFKKENGQKPMEPRPFVVKPVAVQCVKEAIDKKDDAIKNSLNTHNQGQVSAITARNTCQKAALDKTSGPEQFEANKLCVNVFKTSMQGANELLKKSQNESWEIYKKDLKACSELQKETKATSTTIISSNESVGEIMINDGNEEYPEVK